jgi:hypothetical protein
LNREAWEQSRQQWGTGELGAGHGAGGTQFLDYRQVAAVFRLTTTGSNPYTGVPQFWKGTTWADMAEDVSPAVPSLYALDKLTTHPVDTIVLAVPSTSGDGWVFQVKGSSAGGGACDPVDQEEVLLVQDVCLDPIPDFTGATGSLDGSEGVVPKPLAGQQNRYLKGNGTWDEITAEDVGAAPDDHSHTLTLGGDLAGSGPVTGTVNATIANNAVNTAKLADNAVNTLKLADDAVTNAKLRNSAGLSVIGRSANSTGDPDDITAGTDGHVLRRLGTTLGFGTVATAGVADNAITNTKIRDSVARSVIGRSGNSTGDPADIQAGGARRFLASNPANTDISFRAIEVADLPPTTLSYSESAMANTLSYISPSGWINLGVSVTLEAGTWLIGYHGSGEYQFSAGSFGQFRFRLFNVTAGTGYNDTEARANGRNDIGYGNGAASQQRSVTLAASTTIRLEVEFVGLSITWTTANVFLGSRVWALRIG